MANPSVSINEVDFDSTAASSPVTLTDDAYGIVAAVQELTVAIKALTIAVRSI